MNSEAPEQFFRQCFKRSLDIYIYIYMVQWGYERDEPDLRKESEVKNMKKLDGTDIEVIKEMYNADCDYEFIADVIGCSVKQVIEALRKEPENDEESTIAKLFKEGASVMEIAEKVGHDPDDVVSILNDLGFYAEY